MADQNRPLPLDHGKLVDSDKLAAQHLATELNAGSSRVYHVDRLHRMVQDTGAGPEEFLFRHPELHRIIFIKQSLRDDRYQPTPIGRDSCRESVCPYG